MNCQINPQRGCGKKKKNAFYLESGPFSPFGILKPWTWWLGSGDITDKRNVYLSAPPRKPIWFDPAASLTRLELHHSDSAFNPCSAEESDLYGRYKNATKNIGILDHIGSNNYSVWDFVREVERYGPSRRVSKSFAKLIAYVIRRRGPVPIVFTHSAVPVFENREQIETVLGLLSRLEKVMKFSTAVCPTWEVADWGMYRDFHTGNDHYMIDLLWITTFAGTSLFPEFNEHLDKLKELVGSADTQEQTIGASWLTQVTYTLPESGKIPHDVEKIAGVKIVDLDKNEEVKI